MPNDDAAPVDALVTQDDREAAWHIVHSYRPNDHGWKSRIVRGEADQGEIVQTCTRHRTTAERRGYQAATERAARIAERTQSYDDRLQQSAGCSTVGQRIAKQIRGTDHVE